MISKDDLWCFHFSQTWWEVNWNLYIHALPVIIEQHAEFLKKRKRNCQWVIREAHTSLVNRLFFSKKERDRAFSVRGQTWALPRANEGMSAFPPPATHLWTWKIFQRYQTMSTLMREQDKNDIIKYTYSLKKLSLPGIFRAANGRCICGPKTHSQTFIK